MRGSVNGASPALARIALGVGALWLAAAAPASAQQKTDADFSAYCRSKFPNSAYQRFAQSWGTEHACVQGGTRQGIDLAEACRLTTGSPEHEISGARVLCEGTPSDRPTEDARPLEASQIRAHCRERFPGSSYERRPGPQGFEHLCRKPGADGGFSSQRVDLRQVCQATHGTTHFRKQGVQVLCLPGQGPPPDVPPPSVAPGPPREAPRPTLDPGPRAGPLPYPPDPGPRPFPGPPPGPGPAPFPMPSDPSAHPGDLSTVCRPLGGEWRGGTLPEVDRIRSTAQQIERDRHRSCDAMGGGRAMCRNQATVEQGGPAYIQIFSIFQCHAAFVAGPGGAPARDVETAREEACAIGPILDALRDEVNGAGGAIPPMHSTAGLDCP